MKRNVRLKIAGALGILAVCLLFWIETTTPSRFTGGAALKDSQTVVIIDAGHGGQDGGAVSKDGVEEQGINLQIARLLETQLQAFGIPTIMTRTDENSIHDAEAKTVREQKVSDIHNRMKILDETPNAVLVSIHQNKFADASLWGTQVFYSPNTTTSPELASCIQNKVQMLLQPQNKRQIKKSGSSIYLLYRAKKTAVLVECGFMSNPAELQKLQDAEYQQQMAFAIAMGIIDYLNV